MKAVATSERTFSVAMTSELDRELVASLDRGPRQEDLVFAYWKPSVGSTRDTAMLVELVPPGQDDRILQGNVALTAPYLDRVLDARPEGCGIALLHSHLGPGWQGMSRDDVDAEMSIAGPVFGVCGLPLVGLTWGRDGSWSARRWPRVAKHQFRRQWAESVRVVGQQLRQTYHPELRPLEASTSSQVATVSVWGERVQQDLARARVGIVGLGSVGSIVAEGLSRSGFGDIRLIDMDQIEERNLDRTLGAHAADAASRALKVDVAARSLAASHTAPTFRCIPIPASVTERAGLEHVLDCDLVFCCVDRPWPRHVLNAIAYAHLIPVIDGGILAEVSGERLLHASWRIHTVGPEHGCLYCIDALRRSDVGLDRVGLLDRPDYIQGLPPADRERLGRRNVFPFSLSVAAHEILQAVTLISGNPRIGGTGPQRYQSYPGEMLVEDGACTKECDIASAMASGADPLG